MIVFDLGFIYTRMYPYVRASVFIKLRDDFVFLRAPLSENGSYCLQKEFYVASRNFQRTFLATLCILREIFFPVSNAEFYFCTATPLSIYI